MANKKKSTNKVVPLLVIAALVAGGYYWLTTETTTDQPSDKTDQKDFVYVSDIPSDLEETPETYPMEEDTIYTENTDETTPIDSVTPNLKKPSDTHRTHTSKHAAPKQRIKNGYVDEYGNVIYTRPNGKDPITYKTFVQGRWGYAVKYPSFLSKQRDAQNGDGGAFSDTKGRQLVTYASWNVFNETIYELFHKDFPEAKSVTYKKLFRKQKYYIKSGYTKDNRIFYLKESIYKKDDQEVIATLVYYYPKTFRKESDKIINDIFVSFPSKR